MNYSLDPKFSKKNARLEIEDKKQFARSLQLIVTMISFAALLFYMHTVKTLFSNMGKSIEHLEEEVDLLKEEAQLMNTPVVSNTKK